MTMGALHEGHLSLARTLRADVDELVATIFVNPLQFDDPKDLERYPRTLERDQQVLASVGVDVLFAPDPSTMYPEGEPVVTVSAGHLGEVLEGRARPGHFDGVLTVVSTLFHMTSPDVAIFGEKDAQQLIAIRRMVKDLAFPVEIVSGPTVRETDGLALSSRNAFLSPEQRERALSLSRALSSAVERAHVGDDVSACLAHGRRALATAEGFTLDYLVAIHPDTAMEVGPEYRGEVIFAIAAQVGEIRLIDNMHATVGS